MIALVEWLRKRHGVTPERLNTPERPRLPLEALLNHVVEGILSVDLTGRVLFSNRAARHLLGLAETGGVPQPLWEVVRQPALQPLIVQALSARDGAPHTQELSIFAPEERILQIRVLPTRTSEPAVTLLLHDVTELRRLGRVRQDFVANVSHELRTPLTSIKGFIETLLNGALEDPAHNRAFLTLVKEDVDRLARLTDDLLELSTAESLSKPKNLQPVELGQTIHAVIAVLSPQMRTKRVTVTVDQSRFLPRAKGDPDQLQQVFWNLLDNAVKYNVEGGHVVVRLRYHKTFLYVDIEDSGIGIPSEEVPRIFERFYRVDKARSRALGGTGLGLSIVKHIVDVHGGSISVESEPGRGSTFRVNLPVWQGLLPS